jgi:hypothetical protein
MALTLNMVVANGSADAAKQLQSAHEMQGIKRPPAGAVVLQAVLAGTLSVGRVGGKLPIGPS